MAVISERQQDVEVASLAWGATGSWELSRGDLAISSRLLRIMLLPFSIPRFVPLNPNFKV